MTTIINEPSRSSPRPPVLDQYVLDCLALHLRIPWHWLAGRSRRHLAPARPPNAPDLLGLLGRGGFVVVSLTMLDQDRRVPFTSTEQLGPGDLRQAGAQIVLTVGTAGREDARGGELKVGVHGKAVVQSLE